MLLSKKSKEWDQQESGFCLETLTWPEVATRAADTLLVVPLGSTEQHGPHLPLGTDSVVANYLAYQLALQRRDILVAPLLPYGSSGEHKDFPGTLSMGAEALQLVLVELVRSASLFRGAVLISGHGGNAESLLAAQERLAAEGRKTVVWWPRARGVMAGGKGETWDSHAGRIETSIMLALALELVRTDQMEAGCKEPLVNIWREMRLFGVKSVSPNGVLGDPVGSSAGEGKRILASMLADLMSTVAELWPEHE
jgi:creatinine amidohydrolase